MKKAIAALLLALVLAGGAMAQAEVQTYSQDEQEALAKQFNTLSLARGAKLFTQDMPVMTQRLGADPWALVYDDRVYLYMTGDVLEYDKDGKVKDNTYAKINTLNVVSSADLVNWTDHGCIAAAGRNGASKWGNNSWAPAVACKEIDGQMRFFIYFANGGNGIGVLTSDSPTGPFVDPIGRPLVSRNTPNCSTVTWLFDPAVLVDDDGSAYLYFGGGVPSKHEADPGTARVVKLGDDMISLDGKPKPLKVPFLFEDSGINKIGGKYVYSYCTNWNVTAEGKKNYGFDNAQIAYMTSDNPMGPFEYTGMFLKNPGTYFGCYGNNHHCIFEFKGNWYVAWHTQILEKALGVSGGYRSTGITQLTVHDDATIDLVRQAGLDKLEQVSTLNPFTRIEAETIAVMAGIDTVCAEQGTTCGNMVVTDINDGDWLALYGVDFGAGAKTITMSVHADEGVTGCIQLHQDKPRGPVIGYVTITPTGDGYQEITADLTQPIEGVHNLTFLFSGEGYTIDAWQFSAE